jgi:predicted ATP-dependent serine protease
MLLDRLTERAALGQLLEAACGGRSGVLVVRGEVGVGKTALLQDVVEAASASSFRVTQVAGVESEMELAFAALHQSPGTPTSSRAIVRLERRPRQYGQAAAAQLPGQNKINLA